MNRSVSAVRGANSRLDAIGDDEQLIKCEERGNLQLVRLNLAERGPDRGVFIRRILQLHQRKGQTVYKQEDIWPARALAFNDSELIDCNPVIVFRILKVDDAHHAPPIVPSRRVYSTVTPSTSRW
jgi:hypothetical protein